MPVEFRQGPIYFHPVTNETFRKNFDEIFRKPKKEKSEVKQEDNKPTTDDKPLEPNN